MIHGFRIWRFLTFGCCWYISGFDSPLSEPNIDDCVNNLCRFGATCVDAVQDYTCDCLPGCSGTFCTEKHGMTISVYECESWNNSVFYLDIANDPNILLNWILIGWLLLCHRWCKLIGWYWVLLGRQLCTIPKLIYMLGVTTHYG